MDIAVLLDEAFAFTMVVTMAGGLLWAYFRAIAGLRSRTDSVERALGDRITKLETKMELFWAAVEEYVPKMLHSPHTPEMDVLLEKVEHRTITVPEAIELKDMLESEYNGDPKRPYAMGYVLLIARLNDIIRSGENG